MSTPRSALRAGLAALLLISLAAPRLADAAPGAAPKPPVARDARSLPTLDQLRSVLPASSIFAQSDTFLVSSSGFDTFGGSCLPRGWVGEDLTSKVYTHIDNKTVNRAAITGIAGVAATVLPAPISTTGLISAAATAVNDSGRVVFFDNIPGGSEWTPIEVYPGSNLLRSYGSPITGDPTSAAYDPVSKGIVVAVQQEALYRYPSGGGAPVQIAGTGVGGTPLDTTVAFARVQPRYVCADAAGNIYFSEYNSRVRVLRTDGRVVTLAGGTPGSGGDGGPALGATLGIPAGVAVNPAGTELFIVDGSNHVVRRVDLVTGIITTVLGDGSYTSLPFPEHIAYSGGNLFVDTSTEGTPMRILKLSGGVVSVAYGDNAFYNTPAESTLASRQHARRPIGMFPDGAGGMYFSDANKYLVYHLLPDGKLQVVAGKSFGITMGTKALWVGADPASNYSEVSNWVDPVGYGNNWSQRIVSPTFSIAAHPNSIFRFDLALGLNGTLQAEFLTVQARMTNGKWISLNKRLQFAPFPNLSINSSNLQDGQGHLLQGSGLAKVEVRLGEDSNQYYALAEPTQLRIVVQTDASSSNEDGAGGSSHVGAAAIDNLALTDGGVPVFPVADFEAGTLGGWTLAALNGALTYINAPIRDLPPVGTNVTLRSGFDFVDPSCVWTFTSPGDTLQSGVLARLTSPWVPIASLGDNALLTFSGKLNTNPQSRYLVIRVREKNADYPHPNSTRTANFSLNGGASGGDLSSPYLNQVVVRYPQDFYNWRPQDRPSNGPSDATAVEDSIQFVLEIQDQGEVYGGLANRPPTKLPFFDDLRIYNLNVDSDYDGVADAHDLCPDSSAAGQDANGDGCVDPTATMRHVESWAASRLPLHYSISTNADPLDATGGDIQAIADGFDVWTTVPGASLAVVRDLPTPQKNASALDGLNLITFEDPDFQFPPAVVAVTPTLSFLSRTAYDDRIVLPGEIVDADMIFNPLAKFSTPSHNGGPGSHDLKSVVTHEAGHFFGLSHSGVLDASMFFVLQQGQGAASLEDDDRAAIASAYPGPTLSTGFATITGSVTRGSNGQPIPGALVTAVRLGAGNTPFDSTASDYTSENGAYALRRLPAGRYAVRVTPLDGSQSIGQLTPSYISVRVHASAQTNFDPEWWSVPESDRDDPTVVGALDLLAGAVSPNINVITNVDTIPPMVTGVSPPDDTTGIRIDATILVRFSEKVNASTVAPSFKVHKSTDALGIGGPGILLGNTFIFTPDPPLQPNTSYVIEVSTALQDRQGVPLAAPFSSQFSTQNLTTLAISDIQPRQAATGSFITISGEGFDTNSLSNNRVMFQSACSPCTLSAQPVVLTPTSITVRVPGGAVSGPVAVWVMNGAAIDSSNTFAFTVLPPPTQPAPSVAFPSVSLSFGPTDVALAPTPDSTTIYAVGPGGLATINLVSGRPNFGVAVDHSSIGNAAQIAIAPDGLRGLVTRPGTHDVVEVDTDPLSGTFGTIRHTIPLGTTASPQGVAYSPTGRRAYITDQVGGVIHELDVDPASTSRYQEVGRFQDSTIALSGGVVVAPGAPRVYFSSFNKGIRSVDVGALTNLAVNPTPSTVVTPAPANASVAITPGGGEVLGLGNGFFGSSLLFSALPGPLPGAVVVGGALRDVAVMPAGQSALIVNSSLNLLQVYNLVPGPAYHTKSAEIGTGSGPVAVAVNGNGSVLAVANQASRSISIFGTGSGLTLLGAVTPVARPGDQVAVRAQGGVFNAGASVDLSGTLVPLSRTVNPDVAAFQVPPSTQRDLTLTGQSGTGQRTLALPFRIVDPIGSFNSKPTGFTLNLPPIGCAGPPASPYDFMRTSPNGKVLAVAHAVNFFSCNIRLDLFDVSGDRGKNFGKPLAYGSVIGGGQQVTGMDFTTDGRRLWITTTAPSIEIVDTDPSSLAFGAVINSILGPRGSIAADPLGRYMLMTNNSSVTIANQVGGIVGSLPLSHVPTASAFSPDGRFFIAAGQDRVTIINVDQLLTVFVSPFHPTITGGGETYKDYAVAVPSNGKRAVVHFPDNSVAVYNLDLSAGPVGELFFGPVLAVGAGTDLTDMIPSPDGKSVTAGCANLPRLFRIDPSVLPPVVTVGNVPYPTRAIAPSVDGRHVFSADRTDVTGHLEMVSLSEATTLSLVDGGGQVADPYTILPKPIRVRLTDATGRPQVGVVVRFQVNSGDYLENDSTTVFHLTDVNGEAQTTWRLDDGSGYDSLYVSALGLPGPPLAVGALGLYGGASAPPFVVELGPVNGAANINAGTPVFARFNQPMDSVSVTNGFKLIANSNPVPGRYDLEDGGKFLLFRPTALLPFAAACTLLVQAGVLDTDGQAVASAAMSVFTTQAQPSLAVTSVDPPAAPTAASVVLAGAGFSLVPAQNTVLFNGVLATVTNVTSTSLTALVPLNAVTGPVTVQVGPATSPAIDFVVVTNSGPGGVINTIPASVGIRDVAITSDGKRAYVTNPSTNSVTVLDLVALNTITNITVGIQPQGIALTPGDSRAYVANTGSDNVSVIGIAPNTPGYNTVIATIPVADQPVDVAIAPIGPSVLVVTAGEQPVVAIIDGNPGNGSYNQVLATANLGSGGQGVTISPDGTRGYILTNTGEVLLINLQTNAVTAAANLGSGGQGITISPDGTILLVLLTNGDLVALDIVPGSPTENQALAVANAGSGGQGVTISPDGGLAYVTNGDGNVVLVFQIIKANGAGASSIVPGPPIILQLVATIPVGNSPTGVAVDPSHGRFVLVLNSGSGTVSVIGFPDQLPAVPVTFSFSPNILNLKSMGKYIKGGITPVAPHTPQEIVLSSIRLNDVVPYDPAGGVQISHGELIVHFKRSAVAAILPGGDQVPVTVTGTIGADRFTGTDHIKVTHASVTAPVAHAIVPPARAYTVRWTVPSEVQTQFVAVYHSFDRGENWSLDATHLPNNGQYVWNVPSATVDSAMVSVVLVESGDTDGTEVEGILAQSDYFAVLDMTDVEPAPLTLQFAPARPNPASRAATFRFGLPARANVSLEIFDVQGRTMKTLVKGEQTAGWHEITWTGLTESGGRANAGLYLVRFRSGGRSIEQRLVWLQ